jgi:hypothetical protein
MKDRRQAIALNVRLQFVLLAFLFLNVVKSISRMQLCWSAYIKGSGGPNLYLMNREAP